MLFCSCSRDKKQYTDAILHRDSVPGMITYDVNTAISDSGVVRYRIVTAEWEIYDQLEPPMWKFEHGIYLERFTDSLHIDATVKADTAYYFEKTKLWELRHNVHIENLQGEIFDTELLFWNQDTERVWSDLFIRIRQKDRIITGFGFESNQQFTNYIIRKTQGIFPIEDLRKEPDINEVPADSDIVVPDETSGAPLAAPEPADIPMSEKQKTPSQ
ncbi:MAG: LPS export ABC transporter periplasmic protein LptC [Bacteroidaceae bacterium]|nr:LPS export ABC transporter periplasmic protein LptC [Bacteroidaceae bacterium]